MGSASQPTVSRHCVPLPENLIDDFERLSPRSNWQKLVQSKTRSELQIDMAVKSLAKRISVQAGELVQNRKNRAEVRTRIYQQMAPFLKELKQREKHLKDRSLRWYLAGALTAVSVLSLLAFMGF